MSLSLRSFVVSSISIAALVAGCNSILDNKEGTLQAASDIDPNQPQSRLDAGTVTTTPDPAQTSASPAPVAPNAGGTCDTGKRLCTGSCVALTDPTYGCGAESCSPCKTAHSTAACQGDKCIVQECAKGYADCDGKPENGCEVDLSLAKHCGSCNAVCPAASPVCAPSGDTFQCGTGCTPSAPLLCGDTCVSPMTSPNNCGACGVVCPTIANGDSTCETGACKVTCKPDYHACGTTCAVNTDPTMCGAACTPCPVPANATAATCSADTCGFTCAPSYGNCNGQPGDGCEAPLLTDPLNCGTCGVSCGTGTCNNGTCTAAPPADAGP